MSEENDFFTKFVQELENHFDSETNIAIQNEIISLKLSIERLKRKVVKIPLNHSENAEFRSIPGSFPASFGQQELYFDEKGTHLSSLDVSKSDDQKPFEVRSELATETLQYSENSLDDLETGKSYRKLSRPFLQTIDESDQGSSSHLDSRRRKDQAFIPFRRKCNQSAVIHPQQVRISVHAHQAPTVSNDFTYGDDHWKQVC